MNEPPIDRTGWPSGPWDDEPDELEWKLDGLDGYIGLILRNPMGALCGYVGIPTGHALHGRVQRGCEFLAVHGGITFAAPWVHESGAVMWLVGFDCLHVYDDAPGMPIPLGGAYRTLDYVRREVERLAVQLAAVDINAALRLQATKEEGSS